MEEKITITVNGEKKTLTTDPQRPLLDVLREDLHLTGTKYGCGEGVCRSCTVIMDGKAILSCMTPISQADGKSITTIEGLASGDKLHPVQEALLAEGKGQCGYCMPGMIMRAAALLVENPEPTEQEIVEGMNGNICRCGIHTTVISAIRRASGQAKGGSSNAA